MDALSRRRLIRFARSRRDRSSHERSDMIYAPGELYFHRSFPRSELHGAGSGRGLRQLNLSSTIQISLINGRGTVILIATRLCPTSGVQVYHATLDGNNGRYGEFNFRLKLLVFVRTNFKIKILWEIHFIYSFYGTSN